MSTKIGIIRCDSHSANSAGFNCFPAIRARHQLLFGILRQEVTLVEEELARFNMRRFFSHVVTRNIAS